MVGLMLVGHSSDAVRGVLALIGQAAPGVPAGGAGGLAGGRLGTDAVQAAAALQEVLAASGEDGVLVLLDLGSAAMAAELAIESLPAHLRPRVIPTGAPFLEGAVLAAVAAAGGAALPEVRAAAEAALATPKLLDA